MAIKATDIQRGMDVYGSDGEKVGSVAEIYGSEFGSDQPGEAPPTGTAPSGAPLPFLTVQQEGILGLGSKELHVPAEAVRNVVPGERVELSCTKAECEERYRPDAGAP
jgi:hypothetical protein